MAVVGPNVLNTVDVSERLPLMEKTSHAKEFKRGLGSHAIFVPSNLGGRLRVGFKGLKKEQEQNSLGVVDPDGKLHTRDASGEVRIDLLPLKRGHGLFIVGVMAPSKKYKLYAIFEETGTAREKSGNPLIPWNFWYFPFAHSMKDSSAWGSTLFQPLQKYEKAFGEAGALKWEKDHHNDPTKTKESWEGHCHLSAPASILFVRPPAAGLEHRGQKFTCEELKFFAAEFFGRFGKLTMEWSLPSPDDKIKTGPKVTLKPSEAPAAFGEENTLIGLLRALRRTLRLEGRALIMDMRDATGAAHHELWNQAVYSYMTIYSQPDVRDPTLVKGKTILFANRDFHNEDGSSTGSPARIVEQHGEKTFELEPDELRAFLDFRVRFTNGGLFDTSSSDNLWTGCRQRGVETFAPRFAIKVDPPSKTVLDKTGGNPRVDPNHVLEMLHLRTKFR